MIAVIKIVEKTTTINSCGSAAVYEFTCSSVDDIANLPNSATGGEYEYLRVKAGSTCICTDDTSVWMLGADDVWYKL